MLTLTRSASDAHLTDLVGPRSALARELTEAYWQEIETVSNYATSSTNRGGINADRTARPVRETLASDLKHAHQVASRIRQLHATAPGPVDFSARAPRLAPPADPLDNLALLTDLIDAETAAIERYRRIAAIASDARDWVTENLTKQVIGEKDIHRQSLWSLLTDGSKS
ncbi:MAG: ferritin-like domain-containing protein [Solirubrobacteraceae bacterium]